MHSHGGPWERETRRTKCMVTAKLPAQVHLPRGKGFFPALSLKPIPPGTESATNRLRTILDGINKETERPMSIESGRRSFTEGDEPKQCALSKYINLKIYPSDQLLILSQWYLIQYSEYDKILRYLKP